MTEQTPVAPEATPSSSVGQTLRRVRLEKNLTAEQVAQDTKINIKFIRALEEERWNDFPARVYMEGFLKRYADLLSINGEDLLKRLRPALSDEEKPGFSSPAPREDRDSDPALPAASGKPLWFLAVSAGLVLALTVAYMKLDERRAAQERPQVPVEPLLVTPPAPVQPPAPTTHELRLTARVPVWVRVWVDGKVKFEGILPAGLDKVWTVDESLRIMAGNPSVLTAQLDAAPLTSQPGAPSGEIRWKKALPAPPEPARSTATNVQQAPSAGPSGTPPPAPASPQ